MTGSEVRARLPRLHVVTDDRVLCGAAFGARAATVLRCGGPRIALHVRGPGLSGREIWRRAAALAEVAADAGALLLVNDRLDVALTLAGVGAHVGARSIEVAEARRLIGRRPLGASVHGASEAVAAAGAGADFVVLGLIWPTRSHPGVAAGGEALLTEARRGLDEAGHGGVGLLAIGGVTPERVASALGAGAAGVAVLSGVWGAAELEVAVVAYLDAVAGATGGSALPDAG